MTDQVTFTVRNAEPSDYEAFQRIIAGQSCGKPSVAVPIR